MGRHGTDRVTAVSHMVSCLELDWLLTDWDGGWEKGLGVGCVSGGQVQGEQQITVIKICFKKMKTYQ